MDWCRLPPEVVQNILLYLTGDELAKFGSTSKAIRSVVNDDYVWKKICKREEIYEVRKVEISHRAIGLEKLCDWWTTYMESRNYFYFNWKYGRKKVKSFHRTYSDFIITADETGLAVANENGTITVYNSYMEPLWCVEYEGEIESMGKWRDTVCWSGEEGFTLYRGDKQAVLDFWGEVHLLPRAGSVFVFDEDEGHIAGWSLTTLDLISWSDYQSHLSDRVFSDDAYLYGVGPGMITCFDHMGRVTSTLSVDSASVVRASGNADLVAVLFKQDRCTLTLWRRSDSSLFRSLELNRPYCLKVSPFADLIAFTSRDFDNNAFTVCKVNSWEMSSSVLDYDSIANVKLFFLAKDLLVLFVRMDWETYSRMVVCDHGGNVLYTCYLNVDNVLYADRRKVVLKNNTDLQIIYFDHRD